MDLEFWICLSLAAGVAVGAGLLALLVASVIVRIGRRHGSESVLTQIGLCRRPLIAMAMAMAVAVTMKHSATLAGWRRGSAVLLILAACWLILRVVLVGELVLFNRLRMDVADNRWIRRARTQVTLLRRVIAVIVVVLGIAATLMTFPELHAFGASLFASAGVAGIVAGLAAQTTLANMFAGMQLVFTDAIRMDDVVVVEGEWGWIEEITLTYVVVHIWDERRLVLPTSYFTTTPFENWTRNQARVLGAVLLHLDYATPLTVLRERARLVIEASPLWDRQDWVLQVIDTTEHTIVVRVLASAVDGPTAYDLRCEIREALIVFLQENYPQALPVRRFVSVGTGVGSLDDELASLDLVGAEGPGLTGTEATDLTGTDPLGAPRPATLDLTRAEALDLTRAESLDLGRAESLDLGRAEALDLTRAEALHRDRAEALDRAQALERARGAPVELRRADRRRAEKMNAKAAFWVPFPRGSRALRRAGLGPPG